MRVGVIGGTFDPVHNGHLAAVREVSARLGLKKVLFVPAGRPWLKANLPVTAAEHRVAMVHLAIADMPLWELSTVDIERPGPTYTVDTIAELHDRLGDGVSLFFILGWGSLADLASWREPGRLIGMCRLVAVPRPDYPRPDLAALEKDIPGISARVTLLDSPEVPISGTDIRRKVARGESIDNLVPGEVARYIRRHKLYLEL